MLVATATVASPSRSEALVADGTRGAPPATDVQLAQQKIKHIVFLIKENRTFDSLFGLFPGADGATSGKTCGGGTVPLKRGADQAANIDHSFMAGVVAVDGGKMDCFDRLNGGRPPELGGYVEYTKNQIPNYWRYAQTFALADRFFSSAFGPSGIEHLWSFAAQSAGFVGHEGPGQYGVGKPRQYCGDRQEVAFAFKRLSPAQRATVLELEESAATAPQIKDYWDARWPCVDVPVLPDELAARHVSWKEYRGDNSFVQPLEMVRHVRDSSLCFPHHLVRQIHLGHHEGPDGGSLLAHASVGRLRASPAEHLCRRELDREGDRRDHAEQVLGQHRHRGDVG